MSATVAFGRCDRMSSASSQSVSVSGLGISTRGSTPNSSPMNQATPSMYCSGSPLALRDSQESSCTCRWSSSLLFAISPSVLRVTPNMSTAIHSASARGSGEPVCVSSRSAASSHCPNVMIKTPLKP